MLMNTETEQLWYHQHDADLGYFSNTRGCWEWSWMICFQQVFEVVENFDVELGLAVAKRRSTAGINNSQMYYRNTENREI